MRKVLVNKNQTFTGLQEKNGLYLVLTETIKQIQNRNKWRKYGKKKREKRFIGPSG